MIGMRIILEGDGAWPDMAEKPIHEVSAGTTMQVAALANGMESNAPSVAIRIDLADGSVVFCQTSMRLWLAAADAFRSRFGAILEGS